MRPAESGPSTPSADLEAIVVLCAVPVGFDAEGLGADLIRQSRAACVQIGIEVTSLYRWKGVLEKSSERLMLIKTRRDLFPAVEAAIRAVHPYDVPEIIALRVEHGSAPYLAWLAQATAH